MLAAWLWLAEPRRWMRWLGVAALGAVVAQGVLGGLTVLFFLPPAISTAHAGLAEIFFCLVVSIALFTSPRWVDGYGWKRVVDGTTPARLRALVTTTTVLIYVQILLGATMRHTGAGLAIPDFPADVRPSLPDHWDPRRSRSISRIASGRSSSRSACSRRRAYVWCRQRERCELTRPAALLVALVDRTGDARRADRAQPARRLDQQPARCLRRAGADHVAGVDVQKLARDVHARPLLPVGRTREGSSRDRRPARGRDRPAGRPHVDPGGRLHRAHQAASEPARRRDERRRVSISERRADQLSGQWRKRWRARPWSPAERRC